jgi:malonate-semialdehyde dehydrogenase (acetylating)/methylmalonate-semialdehyde dehydrogenase
MPTINIETLGNYVAGRWHTPDASTRDVINPATGEPLARVPLSSAADVDAAVAAAVRAFDGWRRTPATERIQYLFKLKVLLEESLEDIARTITI